MTWLTLAGSYIDLMRRSDCDRDQARAEILHDLISGKRKAAGLSHNGLIETIPPHMWAMAVIKDDTFFDPYYNRGPAMVDFLGSKIATWSSNPHKHGYETAYSDVHVSPLLTEALVPSPVSADADASPTVRKRGRPGGAGSYAFTDEPLLNQMKTMIGADPALSISAAAQHVVSAARGAGTPESKVKRLTKRYSEKFRS